MVGETGGVVSVVVCAASLALRAKERPEGGRWMEYGMKNWAVNQMERRRRMVSNLLVPNVSRYVLWRVSDSVQGTVIANIKLGSSDTDPVKINNHSNV